MGHDQTSTALLGWRFWDNVERRVTIRLADPKEASQVLVHEYLHPGQAMASLWRIEARNELKDWLAEGDGAQTLVAAFLRVVEGALFGAEGQPLRNEQFVVSLGIERHDSGRPQR